MPRCCVMHMAHCLVIATINPSWETPCVFTGSIIAKLSAANLERVSI